MSDWVLPVSWLLWGVVVLSAWRFRSRPYAVFRGVLIGLHNLIAIPLFRLLPDVPAFTFGFLYLHATVFVLALLLVRPRLMPAWYRGLVSLPASYFAASTLFAFPWAIAYAFGFSLPLWWLPYVIGLFALLQSLRTRESEVHIRAGQVAEADVAEVVKQGKGAEMPLARLRTERPHANGLATRPLRVVQITDPHIGPFMSVARLRRIAQRAVDREPDLVLLTGDFLTMESQADASLLAAALEPLKALPGRVFACRGNHDLEAPETVASALRQNGIELLIDAAMLVETAAGPVQVVGLDFSWREREPRVTAACEAHPRLPGALRLVLLHDPGAFIHLPHGDADLVLSGHTHGGQVGLVSFGLTHTLLSLFSRVPDHGLWGRGLDRLYVHRGTGHYGFPLRFGVPSEESLLCVHPLLSVHSLLSEQPSR